MSPWVGHPARRVYLDNAATSFPKPPEVAREMLRCLTEAGGNPGRGAYAESQEASAIVARCRRAVARLVGAPDPSSIVFTHNCTESLNLVIHGILHPGQANHLICTVMDHNSVLRPMHELRHRGLAEISVVPADGTQGRIDPEAVAGAIRPHTRLVAICHASNVTGTIQPTGPIIRAAHARNVPVLV
ncbi:MAG: aminotransferase class V-fold PLP-dependent enzyme, partial [Phycisphaerae bacterium]|nr:aminotransferase class V-fold PLP-dependent enzyme [Phycisphaerae bacterium]MDW8263220.1 aminotransferase class V-fold PLP-dependent enzyme [Phycisphaerales bacterium]